MEGCEEYLRSYGFQIPLRKACSAILDKTLFYLLDGRLPFVQDIEEGSHFVEKEMFVIPLVEAKILIVVGTENDIWYWAFPPLLRHPFSPYLLTQNLSVLLRSILYAS